jgi:hypothetical protein
MKLGFGDPGMQRLKLAVLLAVFIFAGANAFATSSTFDGDWAVYIITETGRCMLFRLPIRINEGQVSYRGRTFSPAAIAISQRGSVAMRLVNDSGSDVVTATGALNAHYGSGSWRAPTMRCTGRWRAEKQ